MNSNRKWLEIEHRYLKSKEENINLKLMNVMTHRKGTHGNLTEDKVAVEIMNYFTKLCKNYYSVLYHAINE